MSEGEGVIGSTTETFRRHPYWIVGGIVAILALLWAFSAKKSKEPQQFSFSYGPSDAQVQAGTALAIAQHADQTQVSLAQMAATGNAQATSSYFDYLTTNSANQLQASTVAGHDAVSLATIKSNTDQYIANINAGVTEHGQDTSTYRDTFIAQQGFAAQTTQANIAAGTAQHGQDTAAYTAAVQSNNATYLGTVQSNNAANASIYASGAAAYTSTYNAAQAAYTNVSRAILGFG